MVIVSCLCLLASAAAQNKVLNSPSRKLQLAEFAIANLYVDKVDENNVVENAIKGMLEQLSPKERDVLILRFGLNNNGNKKTLDEIGSIYGVSRERIRQIENRAISKLKKLCKNKNLTSGLKNYFGE